MRILIRVHMSSRLSVLCSLTTENIWGTVKYHIIVVNRTRTVEELDQRYILTPEKVKDAYLVHLIQMFTDKHDDWSIIIFTNTCK